MCAYRSIWGGLMEIPVDTHIDAIIAADHLAGFRQPSGAIVILATAGTEIVKALWSERVEGLEEFAGAPQEHLDGATNLFVILFEPSPPILTASQALAASVETQDVRACVLTVSGGHYRREHPVDGHAELMAYEPGDSRFERRARALGSAPYPNIDQMLADWLDPVDEDERKRHVHATGASEYLLSLMEGLPGHDGARFIVVMAALIDAAATVRGSGAELGIEQTAPVLSLLDDHRMQRLLQACCQIPDYDTAIGLTCDLARYASGDQRGPALAFVAYAAFAAHRNRIADQVLMMAREAAPDHELVRCVADAINDGPAPTCDPSALTKATASLLRPPAIVYRLADVHALAAAARQAADAAGRTPYLAVIAAEGFRLTCDLTTDDMAVTPLEVPDPDNWTPDMATIEFVLTDDLMEAMRQGSAHGAPHASIRPLGLGRAWFAIAGPPASRN